MALAAVGLLAAGCRSSGVRSTISPAGALETRLLSPTQVLFRGAVRSDGDEAKLKLTLRFWRVGRFELRASDMLGRGLWSIGVLDDEGVWTDLRQEARCHFPAASGMRIGELAVPLSSRALPEVLLGGWPAAERPRDPLHEGTNELRELGGRAWRFEVDDRGGLRSWELLEGGRVELSWRRFDGLSRLSSRQPEMEIEWREVAREGLDGAEPEWGEDWGASPECGDGALS